MKKQFLRYLIITLILVSFYSSFAFAETIKVGIYQNPPLVGLDENNVPNGFFVELLNDIAKKENWDIEYIFDYFDENTKKIENDELDIMLVVSWSRERAERYLYNQETLYINWGQIYSNNNVQIDGFLDLENKTLGVETGDIHYVGEYGIKNTLENFGVNVEYIEYPNRVDSLKDLEENKIDAIVVSRLFGEYYESNYDIKITPLQFNPVKNKIIAGNEKNQYILDAIDKQIIIMKKDSNSLYNTLLNSYLTSDVKPGLSNMQMQGILILLTVLFVSIIAVVIGRKKIKEQNMDIKYQNEQLMQLIKNATKLAKIRDLKVLFKTFVIQMKNILDDIDIEVVVILKKKNGYVLDNEDYIEGKNIKYANKNISKANLKFINKRSLDKFSKSKDSILVANNYILYKYNRYIGSLGFVYIETIGIKMNQDIIKGYIFYVISTLNSIISDIIKDNEQTKLLISLAELIEKRDRSTANHVKRVAEATKLLAREFNYSEKEIYNIEIASSIHDIGKILVPDVILNKPGKLTVEEFEIVKTHATDEFRVLENFDLNLFEVVHNVVRHHHENWDGTGYPDGLRETEIPQEARIVSIIDVFDALMHKRSYKEAWPVNESLSFIENSKGVKFDPEVVEKFMEIKDQIIDIFIKYPTDNEKTV